MKKSVKLSFLFVILSFFIHLYLANQHYNLKYGFEDSKSLCTISDTFNCEAVTLSSYSYFMSLPMAIWGTVFHLIFFVILCLGVFTPEKSYPSRLAFLMAILSAIASACMLAISLSFMSTYCLFCIGLYILSLLNLINYLASREKYSLLRIEDLKEKGVWISLLAIPALAFLFHDMAQKSYGGKIESFLNDNLSQWEISQPQEFANPLLTMGSDNSTFQVVEFADFQCIHCKNSASKLHAFFLSNKDTRFSFYAFPLDGRCNPGATPRDGRSCLMAKAVYCAEKEQKGWSAHRWVFDRFGSPESTNFQQMRGDLQLSDSFTSCLESEEAMKAIEAQSAAGQKAKVDGTPAVFVNGKRLPAGHYIPVLEALYKKIKAQ